MRIDVKLKWLAIWKAVVLESFLKVSHLTLVFFLVSEFPVLDEYTSQYWDTLCFVCLFRYSLSVKQWRHKFKTNTTDVWG